MLRALACAAALLAGARAARADEPAAPGAAAPPKILKVAVMDLVANGVDASQVKTLTEILTAEVAGLDGLQVISSADVSAMLGLEKQKVLLGCDADAACVAEIAGALGADKLVSGSVGRLEKSYVLNLRLIDVKAARAESRAYEVVPEALDSLVDVIRKTVPKLFGRTAAAPEPAAGAGTKPADKKPDSAAAIGKPEPVGMPGSRLASQRLTPGNPELLWQICGWSGVVVGGLALLGGLGGAGAGLAPEAIGSSVIVGALILGAGGYVLGWCSPIGCKSPVLMVGYGGVF